MRKPNQPARVSHWSVRLARSWFTVVICASIGAGAQVARTPYQSVNPFIGTANDGNTYPGASLPFGMIQWSPDTAAGWYRYNDKRIHGFSLTHLSGAGCPVFADFPILPWSEQPAADRAGLPPESASFTHEGETAQPGYYKVALSDGTTVELAVRERAGIARLRFPAGKRAGLLINSAGSADSNVHVAKLPPVGRELDGESITLHEDGSITATVTSGGFCGSATRYTLHVALKTDSRTAKALLWQDGSLQPSRSVKGRRAMAWLDLGREREHLVKVGLSYVSEEKAEANLEAELPGWDFDEVRQNAETVWTRALHAVDISHANQKDQTIFYTALYHNFLAPTLFSDVDGEYEGFDWHLHHVVAPQTAQYANFSDWDTYRDTTPLQAWLMPQRASDMAQSLLNDAAQIGSLPRWAIANDSSYVMGGDSSSILISEFYSFGATAFDTKSALHWLANGATMPSPAVHGDSERANLSPYLKLGYIPANPDASQWDISASETLEFLNADFAIAKFANALGDQALAAAMLSRSANWRKLMDPTVHWIRPKYADGSWLMGFDAEKSLPHTLNAPVPTDQFGFQEGNTYQYTFMLPFDYAGLFQAIGDQSVVEHRLDTFFKKLVCWGEPCFNMGNEPDFVTPYAYTFLGKPAKTASVVSRIENETFSDDIGGLAGNDDLGATSGVYLWNTLGMYPAIPGMGGVVLGTPRFDSAVLRLGDGKTLRITRSGNGIYVQGVLLNGQEHPSSWLSITTLRPGLNNLVFHLGTDENSKWATQPVDRPPSSSNK